MADSEVRTHDPDLAFERLAPPDLGPPPPAGNYVPAVQVGGYITTSSISAKRDGQIRYPGRLGEELDLQDGIESARDAAINCIAAMRAELETLSRIARVVRVVGYVSSTPSFHDQHLVLNGASDVVLAVFGERGRHARAAIGVASLPLDCSVGVEITAYVGDSEQSATRIESGSAETAGDKASSGPRVRAR
jgi:enamine deaminase RidA (YjgF/YER057c/UK114 family)